MAIKTACSSQEVRKCFSCHSYIMWEAVGWCRNHWKMWVPWCGSREPAALTSLAGATAEAFAISNPWVIARVPPLPSAFQAVCCMSCGSYLLESMRTELIRSGVLASFLLYERINTYLGISFICELDGFDVFKCNFSGRYNNTFKLVVGHVQYYFSSQSILVLAWCYAVKWYSHNNFVFHAWVCSDWMLCR